VRQTLLGYVQATLKPYSTTDLTVSWEPFDRRFLVEAALLNAFDRDYDVAPGTDGPGRTVLGSLKVRF
jgi:outer membrane receptor protein involved in Fe transport